MRSTRKRTRRSAGSLHQPGSRWPRRPDAVRTGEGQVRPERSVVGRPAALDQGAVERAPRGCRHPGDPLDRRPATGPGVAGGVGNAPAPAMPTSNGAIDGGRVADRLARPARRAPGRRSEEPEREVQAVEADPADVAAAARHAAAARTALDERRPPGPWPRPGTGPRRTAVARARPRRGTAAGAARPCRAPASRRRRRGVLALPGRPVVRRTSSARSRSRQPSISTVLSSSAL